MKLFGKNFKQHQSSFTLGCVTGNNYFSYFIKYNENLNTFFISDFFIPIDLSDEYHFSLIFTIGIFNIGENIYITSGEGDYYCSIIKFNSQQIIDSCVHDVLSEDFNINNVKFYFQFKFSDGDYENVLIHEITDSKICELLLKCKGSESELKKKYVKYKLKYHNLKKIL